MNGGIRRTITIANSVAHQALHDTIGGTFVVTSESLKALRRRHMLEANAATQKKASLRKPDGTSI